MDTGGLGIERPTGRRRRTESRGRLLAAARLLFVEHGYHATRPQDICRTASLGHGTFYLHFADKRECFLAFVEDANRELEEELARRLPDSADLEGRIRAVLVGLYEYAERHPGVLAAAISDLEVIAADEAPRESLVARWAREWCEALRAGMTAGEIRDDYDAQVLGHAIVGLIHGATLGGHQQDTPREAVIENLTRFLVRGLTSPAAPRPSSPRRTS